VSNYRGVSLQPGISPQEMHEVWEKAISDAERFPGRTIILRLAPGEYPLPETGEYEYRTVPTMIRVNPPGAEVRFRHSKITGETSITTVRRRAAVPRPRQGEVA
jgi:hypothetical protein